MIRVDRLEIYEFRGIRKLILDLKGKNFAICGPNGTGKSGVVDALEFALTGNISRLSGKGTGEVSVKTHAPHVDSRNDPEKARVVLTMTIVASGKQVTIERTVKHSDAPVITPADSDVLTVVAQVSRHPEFALSRRELIRYVLSAPGDRAKEVQILLRLDEVEELRVCLQRIANACDKAIKPLELEKKFAAEHLAKALEIPGLTTQQILKAVNSRRAVLELPPIEVLGPTSSLKDGLATITAKAAERKLSKTQAKADVEQFQKALETLSKHATEDLPDVLSALQALTKEPAILQGVAREKMLSTAIEFAEKETCPVCDTSFEAGELIQRIKSKLEHLKDVARERARIETKLDKVIPTLTTARYAALAVARHGPLAPTVIDVSSLQQLAATLASGANRFRSFLPLDETIKAVTAVSTIPTEVHETVEALSKVVEKVPEPSKQDAARDFLTVGQERLEKYRDVSRSLKQMQDQTALSQKIFKCYAEVSTRLLEELYKAVETNFKELYRHINKEDEAGFDAHLTPSIGKLGFDVDFYGRGYFPPGAYHSEGHQDAMGLCLYLALMKHLLGAGFTFAVLDDVLMSIDSGHRREVCRLLKEKFPNTQFVLTTHDPIWLRHMKTAGLITSGSSVLFRKWTVDQGPTQWHERDVWTELKELVKSNQIQEAAGILRNYLEYVSGELCHSLRARVEYRGDAQYQLGDLLPNAVGKFRDVLKQGKKAAQTWGQKDVFEKLDAAEKAFAKLVDDSNVEQWQINPAIHFNQWANFAPADFTPVIAAFEKLVGAMHCDGCGKFYFVSPERGPAQSLKCDCGTLNVNLVVK